jgi:hypothetical protein
MKQNADEIRLAEFRALREEAWRLVRADFTRLRHDLEQRGIGERIKDRIGEEAHEVWDYTLDVAAEHRGIVAAAIAVLTAWLLRGPIASAFGAGSQRGAEQADQERAQPSEGEDT